MNTKKFIIELQKLSTEDGLKEIFNRLKKHKSEIYILYDLIDKAKCNPDDFFLTKNGLSIFSPELIELLKAAIFQDVNKYKQYNQNPYIVEPVERFLKTNSKSSYQWLIENELITDDSEYNINDISEKQLLFTGNVKLEDFFNS
jgi:hypothetical protein